MITVMAQKILQHFEREWLSFFSCSRNSFPSRWPVRRLANHSSIFALNTHILRFFNIIQSPQHTHKPKFRDNPQQHPVSRQSLLLFLLTQFRAKCLQLGFLRRTQPPTQQPSDLSRKLSRPKPLMQRACDLDTHGNLTRRLEFAKTLV